MDDAHKVVCRLCKLAVGKVHGIYDLAGLYIVDKLVCRHACAVVLRLGSGCSEVGYGRHSLHADKLIVREVCDICADVAVCKRRYYILGVYKLASCKVEYSHALFHPRNAVGANRILSVAVIGQVQGDIIGHAVKLGKRLYNRHARLHAECGIYRQKRVIAHYLHAQRKRGICNLYAYCAKSDDT